MFYKCQECGHIFENGEQDVWYEPHGERMSGCPLCFGAYEEAKKCKLCGKINCLSDEILCDDCKKETTKQFQKCLEEFTEEQRTFLSEEGWINE